ncbi:hypothetical protein [Bacillus alkalicellulosilyticus]|uniref:hypothetical protein n=1 Tax=Alkalihalobacterium alkalicellulosilyticum TaxID=1912214 RepID=UPI000996CE89|nr:hypothetical protein [Bacillus alkalicellulosilyticus]
MGIVDFLFNNPFLLILIAIWVFNRFRRQASAQQQQQGQPQKQAQRQEQEIDWKEIFRQEEFPEQEKPAPRPLQPSPAEILPIEEDRRTSLQIERDELRQKQELVNNNIFTGGISDGIKVNEIGKKPGLALHFNQITNEEAMKGVVWAEVLGKPRAKRSHRQ